MNTYAGKIFFKVSYTTKNSNVYIWYFVASWACEVTVILTQKGLCQ